MVEADLAHELEVEQHYVDGAYRALEVEMAGLEADLASTGTDPESSGSRVPATLVEREAVRAFRSRRLADLRETAEGPICFGRLDFESDRLYIGRSGLGDPDHNPVVVDWRAPVASAFYRATPRDPRGVVRRRHVRLEGRAVAAINDEVIDVGSPRLADHDVELVGEAALLAALAAPRDGKMAGVVATIQAEQDVAIRAPAFRSLTVQGGPGTGKTAVALHRLSYLLYESRVFDNNLLVIGPSARFLRYIRDVLPSLGAHEVELATPGSLYFGDLALRAEGDEVALIKGSERMAAVLRRALRLLIRRRRVPLEVPWGAFVLRLDADTMAKLQRTVRQRGRRHNRGGLLFRDLVRSELVRTAKRQVNPFGEYWAKQWTDHELDAGLRESPALCDALDRQWPLVTPEQLLRTLYRSRPLLTAAGRDLLTGREVDALVAAGTQLGWSVADAALLDELTHLLGVDPSGLPFGTGRPAGFAYVAVDESQDLSEMAWRMIRRRAAGSGLTVVGDIAQGTYPWSARTWDQIAARAGITRRTHVELEVGYRTPREVMVLAEAVLLNVDRTVTVPTAVRSGGRLAAHRCGDAATLVPSAARLAAEALAAQAGTVAIITPDTWRERMIAATAPDPRLAVLTARASKGLEFDVVVLVEPAAIVAGHDRGWHLLYVALTRPLAELVVVHHAALPWEEP